MSLFLNGGGTIVGLLNFEGLFCRPPFLSGTKMEFYSNVSY